MGCKKEIFGLTGQSDTERRELDGVPVTEAAQHDWGALRDSPLTILLAEEPALSGDPRWRVVWPIMPPPLPRASATPG